MNCPNCGFDVKEGLKFCANCGTPQLPKESEIPPSAQTEQYVEQIHEKAGKTEQNIAKQESYTAPIEETVSSTPQKSKESYTAPVYDEIKTAQSQSAANQPYVLDRKPEIPVQPVEQTASYQTPSAPQETAFEVQPLLPPEQVYAPRPSEQSYAPPAPQQAYAPQSPQQSYAPPSVQQPPTSQPSEKGYVPDYGQKVQNVGVPAHGVQYPPQQKKKKGGKIAIIIVSVILGLALIAAGVFLLPKVLGGPKGFSSYEELLEEYFNILEEGDRGKFKNLMEPKVVKSLGKLGIKDADLAFNRDAMTYYYGGTVNWCFIESYDEYTDSSAYKELSFWGVTSDEVDEYVSVTVEAEIEDVRSEIANQIFEFDIYRVEEKWYLIQVNEGQIYEDVSGIYYNYEDVIDAYFVMFEEGIGEDLANLVQPQMVDFLFMEGFDISTDQTLIDSWTDYYGSSVQSYTIDDTYYYDVDSGEYEYIQDWGFDVSTVEEYINVKVTAVIDDTGETETLYMDFDMVSIDGYWYIIVVY